MWSSSLLNTPELLQTVLSARVLDAAQGTSSVDLQQAFTVSYTSKLCTIVPGSGLRHLLQPTGLTAKQKEPLKFEATVVEDLACYTKGEILDVEVNLTGARVWVKRGQPPGPSTKDGFVAQLVLGQALDLLPQDS